MGKLTKEQIDAINNYGKHIQSAKNDVEAIRMVPGMYIGDIGTKGFLTLIREIYQNAIDQTVEPESPGNCVEVTYNMNTLEVSIADNGVGIPFDKMTRIYTKNHTSGNYAKEKGRFISSTHGIGSKAVNALSKVFKAESYRYDGQARLFECHEGEPVYKDVVSIPNPEKRQGTKVTFIPSVILGDDIDLDWKTVYTLLREIAALTPLGTVVNYTAIDGEGKMHTEHIVNEDGIMYFQINNTKKPLAGCEPIMVSRNTGELMIDAIIGWDVGALEDPSSDYTFRAYCNFSRQTDADSTNVKGVLNGVTQWVTKYMNNVYLANAKSKIKVIPTDVKCGLTLTINTGVLRPIYGGQAKQKLSNEEVEPFCKETVTAALDEWAKSKPNDLSRVCAYIKSVATIRIRADKEKVKITTSYSKSAFSGLPAKYKRPTGKDHLELIICEGDSAGGAVNNCRDAVHQGLFPIRGKIISAFSNSPAKVLNNAEFQGICKIVFGCTYRKGLTAKDCKFEKIIFMADADVDGSHICSLLERLFLAYFPFLFEAGIIYKAVPPLYMIKNGKKKKFFAENSDIVDFTLKAFQEQYKVTDMNKRELTRKELKEIFIKNADYVYEMGRCATNHGLAPLLMEVILTDNLLKKSSRQLIQDVKKKYRFVTTNKLQGIDVISVSDDKLYTAYITEELIKDSTFAMDILNTNSIFEFIINGKPSSIYELMVAFESLKPTNLKRFKGLGEMNPDDLRDSTVDPQARTLIRYTVESLKDEISTVKTLDADKKKLLGFIGKVSRKDLIGV